ncbi:MAG: maltose/maltodextrin ABC transporter substrate-binding protein MalE [Candidatus Bipolaricaulota bacterium]|nr:maltose ABC transporter substrate-binding protein [Candidatus Bipolaricaulota bacterium]
MKKLLLVVLGLTVGLAAFAQAPKLVIWADDTRTPVLRDLAVEFKAITGVEIEVVEIAFDQIRGQFITAAPTGQGPDIIVGAHDWVGELAANGLLEPVDFGPKLAEFSVSSVQAFSYGGKNYGVPQGTENIAIIYNKALVPEMPKTWDELLVFARQITDPTKPMYALVFQNGPDPYHWFPMLSACGGYVFGPDASGALNPCDVGLANEGALRGAQLFADMIEEGLLPAGVSWDTMRALFFGGNAAMVISGPWLVADTKAAGIDYGIAMIPSIQCADGSYGVPKPFIGVQGFMVSAFSQNKLLAFDFLLNYIATTDTMLALYNRNPRPPAHLPTFELVKSDPDIAAFGLQGQNGIPMPNIPEMASVWGAWADAQSLIANGQATPEQALQEAVQKIKAALKCP